MSKIYFVLPAYNEEANIEETIVQWYPVVEKCGSDCRLVIANDGSKDQTYEKLAAMQPKLPQLVPLDKPNRGHGPTVIYLYRYAIEHGADYIFQTDSDGQTNPQEFDAFLKASCDYDCVMGCRPVRGDGKSRKVVENVLRTYVWLFFHVWVHDANAPFRLMKASVVARCDRDASRLQPPQCRSIGLFQQVRREGEVHRHNVQAAPRRHKLHQSTKDIQNWMESNQ